MLEDGRVKIFFITAETPWGRGETFILEEILELKKQGADLLIVPRNPSKEVFHKEAQGLLKNALWLPLINLKMIAVFLCSFLTKRSLWKILYIFLKKSRNYKIFIKNLAVFPKAVFLGNIIKKNKVEHIHAHWGATTATMAFVIHQITKIPWSFTLHRWDISENNLLKEKVESVKFARIISEHGKNELLRIVGRDFEKRIKVIHMGAEIPYPAKKIKTKKFARRFAIITPANLIEKKGHKYLIEACQSLIQKGLKNFQCIFYGEGFLRNDLESLVKEKGLERHIEMPGVLSHEKLMGMYQNGKVDLVVLPSIVAQNGELEGIPVALMEAMAYRIPVISTNTGGTPELLNKGAGIIVKEKSSEQLTRAISRIMAEENFKKELAEKGFQRIKKEFDIQKSVKTLIELIKK